MPAVRGDFEGRKLLIKRLCFDTLAEASKRESQRLQQRKTSITASSCSNNHFNKSESSCLPRVSQGPMLLSYQLLGDSLFVRYADQILHQRAVIRENGKFSNGDCVSGQTVEELIWRVNRPTHHLSPNICLLIGTNDFLKGSKGAELRECMKRLLDILCQKAHKVVVLTLPPIPRLGSKPSHWRHWEQHNEWIKSLDDGSSLRVIDVAPLFLLSPRQADMSSYESYMGHGKRKRVDHVHLNRKGLMRLNQKILNYFEVTK